MGGNAICYIKNKKVEELKMVGRIKSWTAIPDACGIIVSLSGKEIPVRAKNVIVSGAAVFGLNDVVGFELGTDENGKEEAINVSLISKAKYAIELSKLQFKDFGLDIKNNILNPPKGCCDEYCVVKWENAKELQDNICHYVCKSDKYPCCVAVLRKDNTVVVGYSDKEKQTEICRFQRYGIEDAPTEQQYLAVGELIKNTMKMEYYGIMVELENDFYQTIMK